MNNRLYYGDNLEILRNREYFPDACVDLIYLDPPFNSNRNYNVLFKSESGADSEAQITAFEDTWHWGETAEATYDDIIVGAPHKVATAIEALMNLIERNQMMAYLVMMTARLVELHRVLKPTGSLYLHCDPTASHYLKIVLDAIFGHGEFSVTKSFGSARLSRTMMQVITASIQGRTSSTIPKAKDQLGWNGLCRCNTENRIRNALILIHRADDDGRWMSEVLRICTWFRCQARARSTMQLTNNGCLRDGALLALSKTGNVC